MNTLFIVFQLIIFSKLIPVVADKVKLRDEAFVADHPARPLPVSDAVADLEREGQRLKTKVELTWQAFGRAEVATTRPKTEAATLFSLLVLARLS